MVISLQNVIYVYNDHGTHDGNTRGFFQARFLCPGGMSGMNQAAPVATRTRSRARLV